MGDATIRDRGDDQLADFFQELQAQDRDRAERPKPLLKDRIPQMDR